ncbi:MAG: amidohydrolase [Terriglobia bacterium]|nr:amidohydrolase [Terriglobia bacterium]
MKPLLALLLIFAGPFGAPRLPQSADVGTMHSQDKMPETKVNEPADTIFLNGNIWTGVHQGNAISTAQALAVKGDRILAVGTNDEVRKHKDKDTRVIDLGGRFVMPGFNDAHLHLSGGGFEKLNVDLTGTKSLAEMKQRIAARAKATPAGQWILGRGWDETKWTEQVLPTRHDLDAVTGDHPAIFGRVDGHSAVANSAALKLAGIDRNTKDPTGGKIDRDASGEPTGILRESAGNLVSARIPPPTPAQVRKAMELALADAAQWGLTSVQSQLLDNREWADFLVCEDLEREGHLTARVTMWLPFDLPLATIQQWRAHHSATDPMLHTGMLKAYMDGSLGSHTAALREPYSDEPSNKGLAEWDQSKLNRMAEERAAAGFQLGFHAIGDRAADMALEAFASADRYLREHDRADVARNQRYRIEHDQVIEPDQFAKYKALGVIASVQPNHLLTDMNWAEKYIGAARAKTSYPWRSFLQDGIVLAFGTDYPVEPLTPFRGIYAAVTRKNEAGTREYFPEQKLTIDEALEAYTSGSAYAEFAERDKGQLKPGMLADFVVLDRDLTKIPPHEILGTKVLRTVVGGKTVYEHH